MKGPVNPNRLAVSAVAAVAVLLGGAVGCGGNCLSSASISTESRLPTGAVGAPYRFRYGDRVVAAFAPGYSVINVS